MEEPPGIRMALPYGAGRLLQYEASIWRDDLSGQVRGSKDVFQSAGDVRDISDISFRNRGGQGIQFILIYPAQHVGHDHSGGNGIYADSFCRIFKCQCACQANDAGLCSTVISLIDHASQSADRRSVADYTLLVFAAVIYHIWQNQMGHVEETHKVGGDHALISLRFDVDPVAVVCNAGVIHQGVDPVAKTLYRGLYQGFTLFIFAYICPNNQSFYMISVFQFLCDLVGFCL